ncbi:GNAT family N-acetyltransferase [Alicyclobacillus sp. SO9]|uniref:GNAT family N-acetyltransferase n=1 Tax=Alicyclobacillus sp. SO9 TaxID=2665646 RepID=UPI0018E8D3DF|nr:GNAT family N-acetyltransferase [Alicyclobacillus sp. SO9]QQE80774.1 GNAT family N-acetyltransferase [Alicyclobacillus sp. SO9]
MDEGYSSLPGLRVQRLSYRDISSLCSVADEVGWSFSPERMKTFLQSGCFWGHYANNGAVSSAAVFPLGEELSAIGLVMVKPEYHRQGLGKSLVQLCLENMGAPAALLVATEMGAPLYSKSGFTTINDVQRWIFSDTSSSSVVNTAHLEDTYSDYVFEPLCVHHIPSLEALDYQFTGIRRHRILDAMTYRDDGNSLSGGPNRPNLASGVSGIVGLERGSRMFAGFTLVNQSTQQIQIGPVIASSDDLAIQLLHHTVRLMKDLAGTAHPPFRVDVLAHHRSYTKLLEAEGWKLQKISPLMLYGSWNADLYSNHVYGLIDPAFG